MAYSPKYCAVCGAYIPDALDKCLACGKKINKTRNSDSILQYYGFSTDIKPTVGTPNASTFYTLDTGEIFMYEAEDGVWYRQYAQDKNDGYADGDVLLTSGLEDHSCVTYRQHIHFPPPIKLMQ